MLVVWVLSEWSHCFSVCVTGDQWGAEWGGRGGRSQEVRGSPGALWDVSISSSSGQEAVCECLQMDYICIFRLLSILVCLMLFLFLLCCSVPCPFGEYTCYKAVLKYFFKETSVLMYVWWILLTNMVSSTDLFYSNRVASKCKKKIRSYVAHFANVQLCEDLEKMSGISTGVNFHNKYHLLQSMV